MSAFALRALAFLILCAACPAVSADAKPQPAIAMHGAPLYSPGFRHFAYADPDAPKGGSLTLAQPGTFDSLNPFIVKGMPAAMESDLAFESLMARSQDEPFTLYGLIAETVEVPPDRSWVEFALRPEARFQDGTTITVEDVVFSFKTLRDHGRPNHRLYYRKVARVERPGPRRVRFVFQAGSDWEMPLIMGLMPVLPEARYDGGRFERATLDPPLGSGPYRVASVSPGRSIVYKRVPGYWGRDLPVNRGLYNFDTIRIDYYRDDDSSFEAFKAGLYDLRVESDPARWARGYDFPDARRGLVIRKALPHGRPSGLFGFVLNTRRPLFRNIRVREALDLAFDFEWVNRSLFFGAYRRISSSFDNSELAAHGPPTPAEARLLAPWQSRIPDAIWRQGYVPPVAQDERNRRNLERAQALLKAAGYEIRGGRLVDARSGRPFAFEILLANPNYERLALVYARMLKRLGIQVSVRTVDPTQYEARREQFDFDVIVNTWGNSLSPGNEQAFYWGSAAADEPGSRNYPGVRDPALDAMIAALIQARTRADLVAAARALDRLLMAGRYVVPLYFAPEDWLAWRNQLRMPDRLSRYGYSVETWWRAHGR